MALIHAESEQLYLGRAQKYSLPVRLQSQAQLWLADVRIKAAFQPWSNMYVMM